MSADVMTFKRVWKYNGLGKRGIGCKFLGWLILLLYFYNGTGHRPIANI